MRLDPLVKEKYPKLTIGYAIARNVKVERTVKELEEEKQRVVNEFKTNTCMRSQNMCCYTFP